MHGRWWLKGHVLRPAAIPKALSYSQYYEIDTLIYTKFWGTINESFRYWILAATIRTRWSRVAPGIVRTSVNFRAARCHSFDLVFSSITDDAGLPSIDRDAGLC